MDTKKTLLLLLGILSINYSSIQAQNQNSFPNKSRADFRIMFYNVENLFDIYDDSLTNDNEFLPKGDKYWSYSRFYDKINKTAKVITAVGQWQVPDIVGLCEIENRYVLSVLTKKTILKTQNYGIIHKESPDLRGIDVGLLYNKNTFNPISYQAFRVDFKNYPNKKTRDILYVKGYTKNLDTLHIFINHWPSRYGGQLESEVYRIRAATVIRNAVDSIFNIEPRANMILLGDFNDYPHNKSIKGILRAHTDFIEPHDSELYNLSVYTEKIKTQGTHKYGGLWGVLDQIIVSGALLNNPNLETSPAHANVYNADFLLEEDKSGVGFKPNRTYIGFRYNGGFSDHLPIYLDLFFKKQH